MPSSNDTIVIDRILSRVAEYKASDVHLTPGNPPIVRVDGKLVSLEGEAIITPDFLERLAELLLSEPQRQELADKKELVIAATWQKRARYKISFFHQRGSLSASLRLIPQQIPSLEQLGLPAVVQRLAELEKGLVLVTGPFGSGRTATASALLDRINQTRAEHVVTIEKPIEQIFVNSRSVIEQREVGRDTLSFEQALATASREDVDVIFVSEMEDTPVIEAVLNAAESARLVISTMNTDSIVRTIEKILTSFPEDQTQRIRVQLAATLQAIVSQRLLPRVGGGRIVVAEVMLPTGPIRSVIRDGQLYQLTNLLQTSREQGMISLDRSLAELVKTGEILMDDAIAHAVDRNSLKSLTRM
ncbi:MAG: PilT/PilU family type 4a pilus ATPase [Candidatus Kerfeldbacteria bacterium]|nr:PilT/PilU family type 4a pilus ATPase [Candidatus Kerfeldbacteria bacterium]